MSEFNIYGEVSFPTPKELFHLFFSEFKVPKMSERMKRMRELYASSAHKEMAAACFLSTCGLLGNASKYCYTGLLRIASHEV